MKRFLQNTGIYWWAKEKLWQVKFWWNWQWFRKNKLRLRNIAAWARQHDGIHDAASILAGNADKRIYEAAHETAAERMRNGGGK